MDLWKGKAGKQWIQMIDNSNNCTSELFNNPLPMISKRTYPRSTPFFQRQQRSSTSYTNLKFNQLTKLGANHGLDDTFLFTSPKTKIETQNDDLEQVTPLLDMAILDIWNFQGTKQTSQWETFPAFRLLSATWAAYGGVFWSWKNLRVIRTLRIDKTILLWA